MRTTLAIVLVLLGCEPTKSPNNSDPCHPVPPARCQNDGDCFPYLCKTSFCDQSCKTNATCAQGYVCGEGKCVKPGTCGTCSGDYDCKPGQKCDLQTSTCR